MEATRRHAAGEVRYCADALPRAHLHAHLIVSSVAPATVEVDLRQAMRMPGVVTALGPGDDRRPSWTNNPHGGPADLRILTRSPRWVGEPIAAVVATSATVADRAARSVTVHVSSAPAACTESSRIAAEFGVDQETMARVWANAPYVFEDEFTFDAGAHGCIERPAAGAMWNQATARWTVYSTTQTPLLVASALASIFDLDDDAIEMYPVAVGGGFGLKEDIGLEPAALLLSQACDGQAVLVELSRQAVATHHRRRFGVSVKLRTATTPDGTILGREIDATVDGGAVMGHAADLATNGAFLGGTIYSVQHARYVGRVSLTPSTPGAGFRGYGGLEVLTAVEVHMGRIARQLGLEHAGWLADATVKTGETDARGEPILDLQTRACIHQASRALQRRRETTTSTEASRTHIIGWGLASAIDTSGAATSSAQTDTSVVRLRVNDRTVIAETSTAEIGSGLHALLGTVVSRHLGIPRALVSVRQVDTAGSGRDAGVYGSRGAHVCAAAAINAAVRLATMLDRQHGSRADAIRSGGANGLVADGMHTATGPALSATAAAVEVAVSVATGETEVRWVHSSSDIGSVLDRRRARGQVIGGVLQGIGVALHETAALPARGNLIDHMLPSTQTRPRLEIQFLDRASSTSPSGAKGLGELAIMAVPAAIANALTDITGVSPRRFPVTPERVLQQLCQSIPPCAVPE